ncbi:hypothetical protein ACHAWF_017589 [Thalassiosira exigua]
MLYVSAYGFSSNAPPEIKKDLTKVIKREQEAVGNPRDSTVMPTSAQNSGDHAVIPGEAGRATTTRAGRRSHRPTQDGGSKDFGLMVHGPYPSKGPEQIFDRDGSLVDRHENDVILSMLDPTYKAAMHAEFRRVGLDRLEREDESRTAHKLLEMFKEGGGRLLKKGKGSGRHREMDDRNALAKIKMDIQQRSNSAKEWLRDEDVSHSSGFEGPDLGSRIQEQGARHSQGDGAHSLVGANFSAAIPPASDEEGGQAIARGHFVESLERRAYPPNSKKCDQQLLSGTKDMAAATVAITTAALSSSSGEGHHAPQVVERAKLRTNVDKATVTTKGHHSSHVDERVMPPNEPSTLDKHAALAREEPSDTHATPSGRGYKNDANPTRGEEWTMGRLKGTSEDKEELPVEKVTTASCGKKILDKYGNLIDRCHNDVVLSLCDPTYKAELSVAVEKLGGPAKKKKVAMDMFEAYKKEGARFFKMNAHTRRHRTVEDDEALEKNNNLDDEEDLSEILDETGNVIDRNQNDVVLSTCDRAYKAALTAAIEKLGDDLSNGAKKKKAAMDMIEAYKKEGARFFKMEAHTRRHRTVEDDEALRKITDDVYRFSAEKSEKSSDNPKKWVVGSGGRKRRRPEHFIDVQGEEAKAQEDLSRRAATTKLIAAPSKFGYNNNADPTRGDERSMERSRDEAFLDETGNLIERHHSDLVLSRLDPTYVAELNAAAEKLGDDLGNGKLKTKVAKDMFEAYTKEGARFFKLASHMNAKKKRHRMVEGDEALKKITEDVYRISGKKAEKNYRTCSDNPKTFVLGSSGGKRSRPEHFMIVQGKETKAQGDLNTRAAATKKRRGVDNKEPPSFKEKLQLNGDADTRAGTGSTQKSLAQSKSREEGDLAHPPDDVEVNRPRRQAALKAMKALFQSSEGEEEEMDSEKSNGFDSTEEENDGMDELEKEELKQEINRLLMGLSSAPSSSHYEEASAWRFHNPPFPVDSEEQLTVRTGIMSPQISSGELPPLPPPPPLPEMPSTECCTWSFDEKSRVLLANFRDCQYAKQKRKIKVAHEDEQFLLIMMERDDITVISEGLADSIDSSFWTREFIEGCIGSEFHHKIRGFAREPLEAKQVKEKKGWYSMQVSDYFRYLDQRMSVKRAKLDKPETNGVPSGVEDEFSFINSEGQSDSVNVDREALYMIDLDLVKLLPLAFEDFQRNFELPGILPGGGHCMMNAVRAEQGQSFSFVVLFCTHFPPLLFTFQMNANGRPFMGPNLYVTPPSSFTHFHQDGHGTVDSGHLCLAGYNEVVMTRRLTERHKCHALHLLTGTRRPHDILYGLPHQDEVSSYLSSSSNQILFYSLASLCTLQRTECGWPSKDAISQCEKMGYCPSVFILKAGQVVHINKGRLHAFRKLAPFPLCDLDCHSDLRSHILEQKDKPTEDLCFSVAWDWMFKGVTSEGIDREVSSVLECCRLNQEHHLQSLAIPETSLLFLAKENITKHRLQMRNDDGGLFNMDIPQRPAKARTEPDAETVLRGILPSLQYVIRRHNSAVKFSERWAMKTKHVINSWKVSIDSKPNTWQDPSTFALDPFAIKSCPMSIVSDTVTNFFCLFGNKRKSSQLVFKLFEIVHCDGCEKLLNKDFNICSTCHMEGKYKVFHRMHPFNSKAQSILNHVGNKTHLRKARCPCKNGKECIYCSYCTGCSCRCHQWFTLHYRFMGLKPELKLLDEVERIVGSSAISQAAETRARLFSLISQKRGPVEACKPVANDQDKGKMQVAENGVSFEDEEKTVLTKSGPNYFQTTEASKPSVAKKQAEVDNCSGDEQSGPERRKIMESVTDENNFLASNSEGKEKTSALTKNGPSSSQGEEASKSSFTKKQAECGYVQNGRKMRTIMTTATSKNNIMPSNIEDKEKTDLTKNDSSSFKGAEASKPSVAKKEASKPSVAKKEAEVSNHSGDEQSGRIMRKRMTTVTDKNSFMFSNKGMDLAHVGQTTGIKDHQVSGMTRDHQGNGMAITTNPVKAQASDEKQKLNATPKLSERAESAVSFRCPKCLKDFHKFTLGEAATQEFLNHLENCERIAFDPADATRGSRVIVKCKRGIEWRATIVKPHSNKSSNISGFKINYDGNKRTTIDWVPASSVVCFMHGEQKNK